MNIAIKVDPEKCSGCGACNLACSLGHYKLFNPKMAGTRLERVTYGIAYPVFCQHCSEAQCVKSCPTGSIYKAKDGRVLINEEECIGCEACFEACPIKAVNFLDGKAYKCDLCNGEPKCVDVCLTGAITIIEVDNSQERSAIDIAKTFACFLENKKKEGEAL